MIFKALRKVTALDSGDALVDYCGGRAGGSTGRNRRTANGSVGVGGRGHQRQLRKWKLRGAEVTQQQYTEANNNRDGRLDHSDRAGAPAPIAEGVGATNTPRL